METTSFQPVMAEKKLWSVVRMLLPTLRKGVNKTKLMLELRHVMDRAKVARKSLFNHLFQRHHHSQTRDKHVPLLFSRDSQIGRSSGPGNQQPAELEVAGEELPAGKGGADDDGLVDAAAEAFIRRFYENLRLQRMSLAGSETPDYS